MSRPIALNARVQASEHRPSFEVVSVKQNTSDDRRSLIAKPGGRLVLRNFALKDLIAATIGMADIPALVPDRIFGGPDWIASERYNIDAKASRDFTLRQAVRPRTCF